MATNKVQCKCGKIFTAFGYISHIGAFQKLHPTWTLETIQSRHIVVDCLEIIPSGRQFSSEEKAQAGQMLNSAKAKGKPTAKKGR